MKKVILLILLVLIKILVSQDFHYGQDQVQDQGDQGYQGYQGYIQDYQDYQNLQDTQKDDKDTQDTQEDYQDYQYYKRNQDDQQTQNYKNNRIINKSPVKKKQSFYFTQKIDHFNASDMRTYQQRYIVQKKYFNKTNGSVILYVGSQNQITQAYLSFYQFIAKNTSALIIVLQHRYYGKSMPMGVDSLDIQNLIYLSVEQALEDIKQFILGTKAENELGITNNPWIVIGDSYGGSLAGWFRYKYPQLVIGALSSSGVFKITEEYQQYDRQIYNAFIKNGKTCINRITEQFIEVESMLRKPETGQRMKSLLFNKDITDMQFMYYMANVIANVVQYGKRNEFCKLVQQNGELLLLILLRRKLIANQGDISVKSFKNPLIYKNSQSMKQFRAFNYQFCSEIGLFLTPSKGYRMRSKYLNLQFHRDRCLDIYGVLPNITKMNNLYGNVGNATNIISVNGIQDPWRFASIQQNNTNVIAFIIDCQQCSHCVLVDQLNQKNSQEILQVRGYVINLISNWTKTYFRQQQQPKIKKIQSSNNWIIILIIVVTILTIGLLIIKFYPLIIDLLIKPYRVWIKRKQNNQRKLNQQKIDKVINQTIEPIQ